MGNAEGLILVDFKLLETVLIDTNHSQPKNYVILFNHIGSFLKSVGYVEIDVDVTTNLFTNFISLVNGHG